jgi:hypothetical protein
MGRVGEGSQLPAHACVATTGRPSLTLPPGSVAPYRRRVVPPGAGVHTHRVSRGDPARWGLRGLVPSALPPFPWGASENYGCGRSLTREGHIPPQVTNSAGLCRGAPSDLPPRPVTPLTGLHSSPRVGPVFGGPDTGHHRAAAQAAHPVASGSGLHHVYGPLRARYAGPARHPALPRARILVGHHVQLAFFLPLAGLRGAGDPPRRQNDGTGVRVHACPMKPWIPGKLRPVEPRVPG